MKNLFIIAAIIGLAYWFKNRKPSEVKTTQEPGLKSAWLLSATKPTTNSFTPRPGSFLTPPASTSSSETSGDSTGSTGGYTSEPGTVASGETSGNTVVTSEISAYFTRSGNSKSCFR